MLSILNSLHIPPSQLVELYGDIKAGILLQVALTFLHTTHDDDPDRSALAKSDEILYRELQAHWEGRQSKQGNSATCQVAELDV